MIIPPRRQVVDKMMFSPLQKTLPGRFPNLTKSSSLLGCRATAIINKGRIIIVRTFVAIIVRTVVKSLFQTLLQSLSELFLQLLQIQHLKIHQKLAGSVSLRFIYQPLKYLLLSVLMCSRSTIMLFVSSKCQHLP